MNTLSRTLTGSMIGVGIVLMSIPLFTGVRGFIALIKGQGYFIILIKGNCDRI